MDILTKQLKLETKEYFITHLSIINALLPIKLTHKEIEVLGMFMSFTGYLANDRFSLISRKVVRNKLSVTHTGLSNYILSLTKKGFLKKINNKISILPILHPKLDSQIYKIKLINID